MSRCPRRTGFERGVGRTEVTWPSRLGIGRVDTSSPRKIQLPRNTGNRNVTAQKRAQAQQIGKQETLWKVSSYRAVNTRLGYKNQSVNAV